jgi:putative transposase
MLKLMKLVAFCIMPHSLHLLLVLLRSKTLPELMRSFGRFSAARINKQISSRGQFWQEGFFDHRCRDIDDTLDRLAYIEHNPVRAGFVSEADQWVFSSALAANACLLDRDWFSEES